MVRALGKLRSSIMVAALFTGIISTAAYAQEDPPDRVARLNYVSGNVSMEPAGLNEWAPADVNRPFTIGDYLYTDQGSRAELHLDIAAIRMDQNTSFGFLNLDDRTVQIKLTEGDMYFRLHNFGSDQVFEVDTPNAAVTLLRDGVYRFRVDPNGNMSFVVVREGQAEITGGGQAFTLNPGDSAMLTGTEQIAADIETAPAPDDFDNWCAARDAHEANLTSARYLPPTVIGSEDLDDYGTWQDTGDYGPVWYPRTVAAGWAPYQDGHWAWIEPWGWTWVDNMPWGFAPFHYGRWQYIGNRWGWCPGPIARGAGGFVAQPYYAPALVGWLGGAHWGASLVGGGPSLGWIPLGFGEIYTPPYACTQPYFRNVNVYNTRIVNNVNITNVYKTVYVDHRVYDRQFVNVRAPNAVMAMPQTAFASGRPVRQNGTVVRSAELARITNAEVIAPQVAPTRLAVAPTAGRPAPRPVAQVVQRQVVARNAPPAAPAPFAARQQYLDTHAGQPHNFEAMHKAIETGAAAANARVAPNVREAPPAKAVAVRPGDRIGVTPAAVNRQAPQAQPAPQPQSVREPQARQPQHGQPPNQPAYTQRTEPQQQARPVQPGYPEHPQARTPQAPLPAERTQPQPRSQTTSQRPTYPERPQAAPPQRPVYTERTQPQPQARPERQANPERGQVVREQPRPAPEAHTPPRQESRPQPPARAESHSSEQHGQPPAHQDHGNNHSDTKDHQR